MNDEARHHAVEGEPVEKPAAGEADERRARERRLHHVEMDLHDAVPGLKEGPWRIERDAGKRVVGGHGHAVVQVGAVDRLTVYPRIERLSGFPSVRGLDPAMWRPYFPSAIEAGILLGAAGWFLLLFLVFCKVFPAVSLTETKEQISPPLRGDRERT